MIYFEMVICIICFLLICFKQYVFAFSLDVVILLDLLVVLCLMGKLLYFDGFYVKLLAYLCGAALTSALRAFEGKKLLFEKLAAGCAFELWLDVLYGYRCFFAHGSLGDDVKVHLDRASHIAGIVAYHQVYFSHP